MYCHRLSGAVECTLPKPLETGVQVRLISSVGRLLSLFHANYKVKYNNCVDFIRCLDGALINSEVNTPNTSVSDPCKTAKGVPLLFFIGQHGKNMRGNCRFLSAVMK